MYERPFNTNPCSIEITTGSPPPYVASFWPGGAATPKVFRRGAFSTRTVCAPSGGMEGGREEGRVGVRMGAAGPTAEGAGGTGREVGCAGGGRWAEARTAAIVWPGPSRVLRNSPYVNLLQASAFIGPNHRPIHFPW